MTNAKTKSTKTTTAPAISCTYKTVNETALTNPLREQTNITQTAFVDWMVANMPNDFRPTPNAFKKMRGIHRHTFRHTKNTTWFFSYDLVENLAKSKTYAWLRHSTDKRLAAFATKIHGSLS